MDQLLNLVHNVRWLKVYIFCRFFNCFNSNMYIDSVNTASRPKKYLFYLWS